MFLNIWALYRCCFHKSWDNDLWNVSNKQFSSISNMFLWSAGLHGWTDGWIRYKVYIKKHTHKKKITWVLKTPCAELGTFFKIKFCCSHLITCWRLYMLVCHAAFTWNQAAERWQTEDTPSTEQEKQTSSLTEWQDRRTIHVTMCCYGVLVFTTNWKNKLNSYIL